MTIRRYGALSIAACAVGVAIGLYFKTRPASLDQHTRVVDRFGTMHTLDAKIAQETLAARYGLATHYDPLTRSSHRFLEEVADLERDLTGLAKAQPNMAAALVRLKAEAAERAAAVETFKTRNSVLKNSLYYLPLAAQQVLAEIQSSDPSAGPPAPNAPEGALEPLERSRLIRVAGASRAISQLVQETLAQNLLGGDAATEKVERLLLLAEDLVVEVPEGARDRYRLLLAHAGTVSRMQREVDPLVRKEVLGSPVGETLALLEQDYTQKFQETLGEASRYRTILYAWSLLLLVAVLIVAFKLRSLYSRLENLVLERTQKLDRAMKELWGEMELAKKIQTALVPQQLSLRDCQVAAIMQPTDQVGGDYYDVFEVDGVEWVLIGDVSGHGVPAGLIMMMCQTSVRSVVVSQPDIGPDELLANVNRTLTQNIERLGEDKYMTISALRRDPDGSFRIAGMHQDLLVYRAESGHVEHLHAEGTWLGIVSDIRSLNPVRTVKLQPGDALVLYTDGITEARRNDEMLDVEGLKKAVLDHGHHGADEILAGILRTLDGYEIRDDVAAVIIKQLEPRGAVANPAA